MRDSKSGEWGFTGCTFECPISSSSWAVTAAMSLAFVSHHFKTDYMLTTVDGITSFKPFAVGDDENGERPSKSYLSYWAVRIPIMLEWSNRIGSEDVYAAFGPSIEFRAKERSRYKLGKRHTLTRDVNMNPVGINLEARLGYGFLMLYARTSLTPLLHTRMASIHRWSRTEVVRFRRKVPATCTSDGDFFLTFTIYYSAVSRSSTRLAHSLALPQSALWL